MTILRRFNVFKLREGLPRISFSLAVAGWCSIEGQLRLRASSPGHGLQEEFVASSNEVDI